MAKSFWVALAVTVCLFTVGCNSALANKQPDMEMDPTFTPSGQASPAAVPEREMADPSQVAAIKAELNKLYQAYKAKDLKAIMTIIQPAVENTAQEYAAEHPQDPQAAERIRDAYLAFHEDILNHADFCMDEFVPDLAQYFKGQNGSVEVVSPVPVIGTSSMTFQDDEGDGYIVRLRLGRFVYACDKGQWKLVEMDLF